MATLEGTQKKIYDFIAFRKGDLTGLSLRDVGDLAGVGKKPQIVLHHIFQLEKKGYLRSTENGKYKVLKTPIEGIVFINLYQFAECGPEGLLGDDTVIDRVPLPSRQFGIVNEADYFLIKARGSSMLPMIANGDLVLSSVTATVASKDIAVIVHNEMPKIKQVLVRQTPAGEKYSLVSLNTDKEEFPIEDVDPDDTSFRIVGKVMSVIKNNI